MSALKLASLSISEQRQALIALGEVLNNAHGTLELGGALKAAKDYTRWQYDDNYKLLVAARTQVKKRVDKVLASPTPAGRIDLYESTACAVWLALSDYCDYFFCEEVAAFDVHLQTILDNTPDPGLQSRVNLIINDALKNNRKES